MIAAIACPDCWLCMQPRSSRARLVAFSFQPLNVCTTNVMRRGKGLGWLATGAQRLDGSCVPCDGRINGRYTFLIAHCYFVGSKKFVRSNEHDAFYFSMYQIVQHGKIYQLKRYVQHAVYKQRMRSLNECQQIVLQRSFCRFCLQQLLLEHHGYNVLRDTTG